MLLAFIGSRRLCNYMTVVVSRRSLWRKSLDQVQRARWPRASLLSVLAGRFTIGVTGQDGTTYHVHLTATEARQFVDYVDEHT
jgi:polyferredoxin